MGLDNAGNYAATLAREVEWHRNHRLYLKPYNLPNRPVLSRVSRNFVFAERLLDRKHHTDNSPTHRLAPLEYFFCLRTAIEYRNKNLLCPIRQPDGALVCSCRSKTAIAALSAKSRNVSALTMSPASRIRESNDLTCAANVSSGSNLKRIPHC